MVTKRTSSLIRIWAAATRLPRKTTVEFGPEAGAVPRRPGGGGVGGGDDDNDNDSDLASVWGMSCGGIGVHTNFLS